MDGKRKTALCCVHPLAFFSFSSFLSSFLYLTLTLLSVAIIPTFSSGSVYQRSFG